jgi:hypothetical protein
MLDGHIWVFVALVFDGILTIGDEFPHFFRRKQPMY